MSKAVIHPTAIVGKECELGENVEIGPFCILSGQVRLGANVKLISQVNVHGNVEVGEGTRIFPFASLGFPPQDVKWKDSNPTAGVKIGKNCQIRENVTIHLATKLERPTTVGDNCFLMVGCHLGHDGRIGNNVVIVNNVLLAGHTDVGDNATLGGGAAIHQFTRIGRLAFITGAIGVTMDIPPFCVSGARNVINGINLVGLRRAGVPRDQITMVRRAFWRVLRVALPRKEMVAELEAMGRDCPLIMEMAAFVATAKRSVARGRGVGGAEPGEDVG